ncbi:MAG: NAD(+)/NADH kinase [Bacteroidales bacterium]|nr:NAD(+)/NADH kinase [Bacteroidales bacterium]
MKVALYYRHIEPADAPALEELIAELQRCGVDVTTVHDGDHVHGFDYLFSVGGDGTLLSSIQLLSPALPSTPQHSPALPPVVGINFGHLGFLTTVGKENVGLLVQELLQGRFTVEDRTLLQLTHSNNQAIKQSSNQRFALNEFFVHRREEASLLRTQVFVDDDYVATYAGDGVIVATPTGSTAYSLSCGGPILTPTSRCFVITPISAHTLTLRPIIVPDTARITLKIQNSEFQIPNSEFTLGIDSHRHTLQGDTTVQLSRAPFSIKLIRISSQNFFSAIRDKLMWGQ